MVNRVAKASTARGKRLQIPTIAATALAIGSDDIDFTSDFLTGVFVNVAMLCYRQPEKKPAKAPLEDFPVTWNHGTGTESLKSQELEHVLLEQADRLYKQSFPSTKLRLFEGTPAPLEMVRHVLGGAVFLGTDFVCHPAASFFDNETYAPRQAKQGILARRLCL